MHGRRRLACVLLAAAATAPGAAADSTVRASVDSAGNEGDGSCKWAALSVDGRFVAFDSFASNLVPGDGNGTSDVFLFDRDTGVVRLLSVTPAGTSGDDASEFPAISADGRFVAFASRASDLVANDTNGTDDIFVVDLQSGALERVSVDAAGNEGDRKSTRPALSGDGRFVAWYSNSTNLVPGDGNGVSDVFVRDRLAGTIERASVGAGGLEADRGSFTCSLSGDGNLVAFVSDATNLVAGDGNGARDAFVRDREAGTTVRVSVDSAGNESTQGSADSSRISLDGRFVAFYSSARNLVPGDTNRAGDIFVHELATGITELVSVPEGGGLADDDSRHPGISADGRFVAFESIATNLVAGDGNGVDDVFVRDRRLGTTVRISVDSAGAEGDGASHYHAAISADGLWNAFASSATNLVAADGNGVADVFLRHTCAPALWELYGAGHPGALGVPAFSLQGDPELGTTVQLDLGDSTGAGTLAAVLVGDADASVALRGGATLLVVPFTSIVVAVPPGGTTLDADIPQDDAYCGLRFFLQAFELDPAATGGLSATQGLELIVGT